jgi:uncharacterized glyoxalase superfamily protein PhnB
MSTTASEKSTSVTSSLHTVTPHLVCADAAAAIAFYQQAFGATEMIRLPRPDGKILQAAVKIGDSTVMLCDEFPEHGSRGPAALGGTAVTLHLQVPDVEALTQRAINAGAKVLMPVQDMFWGARYGIVADPFGHHWSIATQIRNLSPDELKQAAAQMGGCDD